MRRGVLAVAAACALLALAAPWQALAQDDARVLTLQPEEQASASQEAGDGGLVAAQEDGEQQPADEEPTPELQGNDDGVPQQYTDPLAGEDDANSGQQQSQEQPAPVAVDPVVQSTASELPRTGDPLDLLWVGGGLLLVAGIGLRLACRETEYPYSLPRY